jgi:two-component system chemotaxis sensor kinase CheA
VHSIKGGAGAFGLEDLVSFAHSFETVLDQLRSGQTAVSADVMNVLLRSGDILSDLVSCARDGRAPQADRVSHALAELEAIAGSGDGTSTEGDFQFTPQVLDVTPFGPGMTEEPSSIDGSIVDRPPVRPQDASSSR